jgi:hypothetical protein
MTDAEPDGSRSMAAQLIDVFVCRPLAVAREAQRHLPEPVQHVLEAGERAVQGSRLWVDRRLAETFPEVESALRGLGLLPAPDGDDDHGAGAEGDELGHDRDQAERAAGEQSEPVVRAAPARPARPVPTVAVSELAIPDYESLSASQVVPRLDGLTDTELELVRQYEASARGRRTILSKIAQLQAAG